MQTATPVRPGMTPRKAKVLQVSILEASRPGEAGRSLTAHSDLKIEDIWRPLKIPGGYQRYLAA